MSEAGGGSSGGNWVRWSVESPLGGQEGGRVRYLEFSLVVLVTLLTLAADSPSDKPVRADLAKMVEEVVAKTHVTINISGSTELSVNINEVNGRNVCAPEARSDVERLQRAFDAHKSIYRNIGPALISITDASGKKTYGDRQKLEAQGVLKGCTNILVSVHE
jgi:hypothetical protein